MASLGTRGSEARLGRRGARDAWAARAKSDLTASRVRSAKWVVLVCMDMLAGAARLAGGGDKAPRAQQGCKDRLGRPRWVAPARQVRVETWVSRALSACLVARVLLARKATLESLGDTDTRVRRACLVFWVRPDALVWWG